MSTPLPATVWLLVGLSFGLAVQLPWRITTAAWPVHVPKAAAQALSAYLVVAGLVGGTLAAALFVRRPSVGMALAGVLGVTAALLSHWYLQQIRAPNDALSAAFGRGWQEQLPTQARAGMLEGRRRWALPGGAVPRWERDVVYAKVPETDVELRADVWQPPAGVEPSGLGLIYVHGGSYAMGAKDFGTRPAFRHLARQGHVITDINYRLVDDTDIFGMVADVKRAIIWLKDHTATYGVNPDRIVVAGASAGGNLALLAAYTPGHPLTTPDEVVADTSVRAAVSFYGVHDWPAFGRLSSGDDLAVRLLGGELEDMPQRYAAASPVTHVGPDTPATLLIQGLHDQTHLIDANRKLAAWLSHNGARVATVELAATASTSCRRGSVASRRPRSPRCMTSSASSPCSPTTPADRADTGAQRLPPRPGAHRPGRRPQGAVR